MKKQSQGLGITHFLRWFAPFYSLLVFLQAVCSVWSMTSTVKEGAVIIERAAIWQKPRKTKKRWREKQEKTRNEVIKKVEGNKNEKKSILCSYSRLYTENTEFYTRCIFNVSNSEVFCSLFKKKKEKNQSKINT